MCVCLLFKAMYLVYTSFHFCSVARPPVLRTPGTSCLSASGQAQAEWGSLTPCCPSSSTEGGSVTHPLLRGDASLWSTHVGAEGTPCLGPGVQRGGDSSAHTESAASLTLVFGLLALVGTSWLPISLHLVEFRVPW